MKTIRRDIHAGTWYTDDQQHLQHTLNQYIHQAQQHQQHEHKYQQLCGLIVPHAGYRYSAHTAAYSYKEVPQNLYTTVFVLGPSHRGLSDACLLTKAHHLDTPLGTLPVHTEIVDTLYETGMFDLLDIDDDEQEHSLEMQFPYLRLVLGDNPPPIVPIMVGTLSKNYEKYAQVFKEYAEDEKNLFVISSDFCHWGNRFGYTEYDKSEGEIWQSIEKMDRNGMDAIESLDPDQFHEYLRDTRNTICGRKAIMLYLHTLNLVDRNFSLEFVHYHQSSKCKKKSDSSVSYAAAHIRVQTPNDEDDE